MNIFSNLFYILVICCSIMNLLSFSILKFSKVSKINHYKSSISHFHNTVHLGSYYTGSGERDRAPKKEDRRDDRPQRRDDRSSRSDDNRPSRGEDNRSPSGNDNRPSRRPSSDYRSNSRPPRNMDEKPFYNTQQSSDLLEEKASDFAGDYVYGISPIKMALKIQKRQFTELLIQTGMDIESKKDTQSSIDILNLAKELNLETREMSKHDLNMLTESRPHQGFVLKASKLDFTTIKSLPVETKFK